MRDSFRRIMFHVINYRNGGRALMDYSVQKKIEVLRRVMENLAKERGTLLDKDVIWISQELDKSILIAQRYYRNNVNVLKKAQ